jgi:GNAT superfamily N-acetyltransferase
MEMAEEFVAESGHGWTYDSIITEHTYRSYLGNAVTDIIIIEDKGKVCGAAMVAYDRDFCLEVQGYVSKFYIKPAHRGTMAGRMLCEAITAWFRTHSCWAAFATATAAVGQDKQFVNLFAKFRWSPCGDTLAWEHKT